MSAVIDFVALRNDGVDSWMHCPADFAATTHAADAANSVSLHVVASVFLALARLSPGAGDLPISQFSFAFRAIHDISLVFNAIGRLSRRSPIWVVSWLRQPRLLAP